MSYMKLIGLSAKCLSTAEDFLSCTCSCETHSPKSMLTDLSLVTPIDFWAVLNGDICFGFVHDQGDRSRIPL